jgi:Ca2+-binding EF-hand superfamily protein
MTKRILTIGLGAAAFIGLAGTHTARANTDAESAFQKMDTNADGKLSPDEWEAGQRDMFKKIDANGDGKLSPDELKAGMEKHEKMMGGKTPGGRETAIEKMKMMDTNNDGSISEDEFISSSKTTFDKMDTNHDGFLSKDELKAGHEKMKSKMQEKADKSQGKMEK